MDAPSRQTDTKSPPGTHACLLSERQREVRRALYRREVTSFVTNANREGGVLRLMLNCAADEAKAMAEKMAALEAECCAFLTITYAPVADAEAIEIAGPADFLDRLRTGVFAVAAEDPTRM